ncbi:phosphoribosyl-ATP diphosphatase [Alphaproteobacteria bacterium]|nr:phosphoribosyl-ATP diphosphatase [Alphaproteobacteria bacterium]MDB2584975.1 phosphoribosyl-ATP diphosphatase [Alphaproteobacteria bacterium]MDC0148640.1 phosphoribosyl-ATP diphosphatase [Alphaproteobacteria bacterium]
MSQTVYLDELFAQIEARRGAPVEESYSAQLLADLPRAARKLGEEAVEALTAALAGGEEELVGEAADVLYHLLVVLAARNVSLDDVMGELARRQGRSGLVEKAQRGKA